MSPFKQRVSWERTVNSVRVTSVESRLSQALTVWLWREPYGMSFVVADAGVPAVGIYSSRGCCLFGMRFWNRAVRHVLTLRPHQRHFAQLFLRVEGEARLGPCVGSTSLSHFLLLGRKESREHTTGGPLKATGVCSAPAVLGPRGVSWASGSVAEG